MNRKFAIIFSTLLFFSGCALPHNPIPGDGVCEAGETNPDDCGGTQGLKQMALGKLGLGQPPAGEENGQDYTCTQTMGQMCSAGCDRTQLGGIGTCQPGQVCCKQGAALQNIAPPETENAPLGETEIMPKGQTGTPTEMLGKTIQDNTLIQNYTAWDSKNVNCTDSDAGIYSGLNGTLKVWDETFNETFTDECASQTKVTEYYCAMQRRQGYDSTVIDCPNGCGQGACKSILVDAEIR